MITSLRLNNDLSAADLIDLARAAERAGFDQLWVSNDLMLRSAPVLLGALATATERISLGVGIANPYTVHPAEIAMMAATMQELTGDRFLLGLGAGAAEFLGWVGIAQPKPLTATRDALRAIRALLEGDRSIATEGWSPQAYLRVPPRPTPIYVGAMSPRMVEFAGAEADGVLALLFPPEHYSTVLEHLSTGAAAVGRSLDSFDTPACVWVSVDEDQDAADRALSRKLAYYGSAFSPYLLERAGLSRDSFAEVDAHMRADDEDAAVAAVTPSMRSLGISGTPEVVLDRCRDLIALGARHLSFGPPLGPDPVAAVELFGDRILPSLAKEEQS